MSFLKVTCFILLCTTAISASLGPFGSDAASEGGCSLPAAHDLLDTSMPWLLNIDLSRWYSPVGSAHFFRDIFEHFKGREANSQSELDNWDLNLTYLGSTESWNLYGVNALDVCVLVPGSNLLGIPIFRCALTVYGSLFGIPYPMRTIVQEFTLVWHDNDTNMLTYRCQDGKQDWVHWTRNTINVDPDVLQNIVLPKIASLGFNMSNVEYQRYGQ